MKSLKYIVISICLVIIGLWIALIVQKQNPPVITLNNSSLLVFEMFTEYQEFGATAVDSNGNEYDVVIGGDIVNTNVAGDYQISYDAIGKLNSKAETVYRTVYVAYGPPEFRIESYTRTANSITYNFSVTKNPNLIHSISILISGPGAYQSYELERTDRSITFISLEPDSEYTFKIFGEYRIGISDYTIHYEHEDIISTETLGD